MSRLIGDTREPRDRVISMQSTAQAAVAGNVRARDVSISCVIPTFQRGKVLCATIEMLLMQSHPPHEIVVVDQTPVPDAETRTKLTDWMGTGAIRWLKQGEPNASRARNSGAMAATGEVVLFLDDDIQISSDFIAAYKGAFKNPVVIGVAGQILEGDRETLQTLPTEADDREVGWLYFRKNFSVPCQTHWVASGNFAIRRDTFIRLRGMDENYARGAFREESDFAMRYRAAGYFFYFEPAASIYHLGAPGCPQGGSRAWIRNKRISGWHHCVGDWYFTLTHANAKNLPHLFWYSVRHFVLNRYNVTHPWALPLLFLRWIGALPIALIQWRRGPKLLNGELEIAGC